MLICLLAMSQFALFPDNIRRKFMIQWWQFQILLKLKTINHISVIYSSDRYKIILPLFNLKHQPTFKQLNLGLCAFNCDLKPFQELVPQTDDSSIGRVRGGSWTDATTLLGPLLLLAVKHHANQDSKGAWVNRQTPGISTEWAHTQHSQVIVLRIIGKYCINSTYHAVGMKTNNCCLVVREFTVF